MNKRGIAPVLSVVLITLLVIVGVVILWSIVSKQVDETGERTIDPECFTVSIEPVTCRAYGFCAYDSGGVQYNAEVLVRRGAGSAQLKGIRFSFADNLDRKGVYDGELAVNLDELGSVDFVYPRIPVYTTYPKSVSIIPLVGEEKSVCPTQSVSIPCTIEDDVTNFGVDGQGSPPDTLPQCCKCPYNTTESGTPLGCSSSGAPYCCSSSPQGYIPPVGFTSCNLQDNPLP